LGDSERDGHGAAQIAAKRTPFSRVGADAVIDVNGGEREWDLSRQRNQQIQQYNRVNTPTECDNQMAVGPNVFKQYIFDCAG
jgi:hypothetical protein